jgi:hypothetical protein
VNAEQILAIVIHHGLGSSVVEEEKECENQRRSKLCSPEEGIILIFMKSTWQCPHLV